MDSFDWFNAQITNVDWEPTRRACIQPVVVKPHSMQYDDSTAPCEGAKPLRHLQVLFMRTIVSVMWRSMALYFSHMLINKCTLTYVIGF